MTGVEFHFLISFFWLVESVPPLVSKVHPFSSIFRSTYLFLSRGTIEDQVSFPLIDATMGFQLKCFLGHYRQR